MISEFRKKYKNNIEFRQRILNYNKKSREKNKIKNSIKCNNCGKNITKSSKTKLCRSCWKLGKKRQKDSINKQINTRLLKYGKNQPGCFKKGEHRNLKTEFKKGDIPWNKNKEFLGGEKHWNWKGGLTPLIILVRNSSKMKVWRNKVFKKDNWTCQKCNKRGKIIIESHHIKPFIKIIRENNISTFMQAMNCLELWNVNNGVTLCKECHDLLNNNLRNKKGRFKNDYD